MTQPYQPNETELTVQHFKINRDTNEVVLTGVTADGTETFRIALPLSSPLGTRPV